MNSMDSFHLYRISFPPHLSFFCSCRSARHPGAELLLSWPGPLPPAWRWFERRAWFPRAWLWPGRGPPARMRPGRGGLHDAARVQLAAERGPQDGCRLPRQQDSTGKPFRSLRSGWLRLRFSTSLGTACAQLSSDPRPCRVSTCASGSPSTRTGVFTHPCTPAPSIPPLQRAPSAPTPSS